MAFGVVPAVTASLPMRERGLKQDAINEMEDDDESLPMRERGLKLRF